MPSVSQIQTSLPILTPPPSSPSAAFLLLSPRFAPAFLGRSHSGWDLDSEITSLHKIDFFVVASLNSEGQITKQARVSLDRFAKSFLKHHHYQPKFWFGRRGHPAVHGDINEHRSDKEALQLLPHFATKSGS